MGVAACAALAVMAFIWYIFWGYKANGQAKGTRQAVSRGATGGAGVMRPLRGARRRQESLDQARAALGDKQLQQAYARGKALSFDQAIDLAFGESLPAT